MNRGSDSILSVYSDARAEYTKQLCVFLVPAYFQFFIELLEKSKLEMTNEPKRALWQFQTYLNEIHEWNMEKVHNEIQRIFVNCGCDYLEDLLTAVFIAHTKVLTAIRLSANKKKIEINVPKVEHFLFKVLCETSKLLWSSTYLFRDGIPGIEKQQNYRNIEQIIGEGILQAVRSLVPVKSILRDFVNSDTINEVEEGDDADSDDEKDNEKEEINEVPHKEQKEQKEDGLLVPLPVLMPEVAKVESHPIDVPTETIVQNEVIQPINDTVVPLETAEVTQQINPPTIVIDDKPTVRFGEFDAIFDSENPYESDLIYDPKDGEEDDVPALEILDEQGTPLAEGLDFDELDESKADSEKTDNDIGIGEYEELN
jgi:hypothetical protein